MKYGEPPYLECSSSGDFRFSAFSARVRSRGNDTIEHIYQAAKVFDNGETGLSWRRAKGRYPVNADEVRELYSKLWDEFMLENPDLMKFIRQQSGLSDIYAKKGHACQAEELWRIRNDESFGVKPPKKKRHIEEEEM